MATNSSLMPYNYICIHAGRMLTTLTSLDSLFSASTLIQLALLAFMALGPSFLVKQYNKNKEEAESEKKKKLVRLPK